LLILWDLTIHSTTGRFLSENKIKLKNNLNYSILCLMNEFGVIDRNELIRKCIEFGYDTYIPDELFSSGIYDLKFNKLKTYNKT